MSDNNTTTSTDESLTDLLYDRKPYITITKNSKGIGWEISGSDHQQMLDVAAALEEHFADANEQYRRKLGKDIAEYLRRDREKKDTEGK